MAKIIPITELRDTNKISEICNEREEPVFITKNGYGDLVIMSIETYENILENSYVDNAIAEAESEYKHGGKLISAKDALSSLRRKHFE